MQTVVPFGVGYLCLFTNQSEFAELTQGPKLTANYKRRGNLHFTLGLLNIVEHCKAVLCPKSISRGMVPVQSAAAIQAQKLKALSSHRACGTINSCSPSNDYFSRRPRTAESSANAGVLSTDPNALIFKNGSSSGRTFSSALSADFEATAPSAWMAAAESPHHQPCDDSKRSSS